MALFEPQFLYVHNRKNSRNYATIRGVVRVGASKLPGRASSHWTVGANDFDGKEFARFDGAKYAARKLLNEKPTGTEVHIRERRPNGDLIDQVRFRKTIKRPIADTPGNVYLDRVEGYIEDTFKDARWAGDCVCKPDSDHAQCRAVDYFMSASHMMQARDAILRNQSWFNYTYVILFDRIWYGPSNSSPYTGVYHSHIHVSVGGPARSAC